ncbi:hypothetical protein FG386_000936 [Cryptosporidium ryanae]|uniref:uncharacterized protein n=1 Tax=Cryptosporidium ryanae TaxID=515981 RepID=UPI00351A39A3|nr:hypothetical protein FG386_000936 [Cryptosporidium ryanae]
MSGNVCCIILNQIPLMKYSDLGVIVRVQASRRASNSGGSDNVVFDVFVNDIVPTKSTHFRSISVNNSGDMIQLSSLSCCVVAAIPWKEVDSINVNIKGIGVHKEEKRVRRTPHKYGLFDEELSEVEPGSEFVSKIDINNNYCTGVVGEIPLIKGVTILSVTDSSVLQFNIENSTDLICAKWYNLDDYTLFLLLNETYMGYNYSKVQIYDLENIIKEEEEGEKDDREVFMINEFEFKTMKIDEHTTVSPVDFAFGRGPDIWNMLSLFVLFDNNTIETICPVVSNRMRLPYFAYEVFFSSLIEQEFIFEAKNKSADTDCEESNICECKYDKCFHDLLILVTSDLRNPIDDKTGEIIDDYIEINIPIQVYKSNFKDLLPNQTHLKLNWESDSHAESSGCLKSLKLSCVTNYPVSVFIVYNSKKTIGLFTSSYLSFPSFKQSESDEFEQDNLLYLVQNFTIPSDWYSTKNDSEYTITDNEKTNNIIIYDKFIYNRNTHENRKDNTLFVIGISVFNTIAIIHIDWLQLIFSLHSNFGSVNSVEHNICNECKECEDKQLRIYSNIEAVRGYLNDNKKLKIQRLCDSEFLNLSECNLGFAVSSKKGVSQDSKSCCNLEVLTNESVKIELICPFINNKEVSYENSSSSSNDDEICGGKYSKTKLSNAKLISSKYDELPFIAYNEVFQIRIINKEYFIDKSLVEKVKLLSENAACFCVENDFKVYDCQEKNNTTKKNIVNGICEYDAEKAFKHYFESLKSIKNEFKKFNDPEEITSYHLKLLRLFNEFNKSVLVRLNSQLKPTFNLIDNVKSRIKLIERLKNNISNTRTQIVSNEERINKKIKDAIEKSEKIQEKIYNIKKLFVHELNIHRLNFNKEVIVPEILLMLSNVQLELCSCIINVFNNNQSSISNKNTNNLNLNGSGIDTGAPNINQMGTETDSESGTGATGVVNNNNSIGYSTNNDFMNDINAKLQNYINHNKIVLDKYQSLQSEVIELNKYIHD